MRAFQRGIVGGVLLFAIYSAEAFVCSTYFADSQLLNPLQISQFSEKMNFDLQQVSFKAQGNTFTVFYNQKPHIQFQAKRRFDWNAIYPHTRSLNREASYPKGLGTLAYLFYARLAYLKEGYVLQSDFDHHLNPSAKAVWARFVELGLAQKGSYFSFKEDVLKKSSLWKEIDNALKENVISTDFLTSPQRYYFN